MSMAVELDHGRRSTAALTKSGLLRPTPTQPAWSSWNRGRRHRCTVGIEEELMLLGSLPVALAECVRFFVAARDGLDARLIDPATRRLVPARAILDALVLRCREHADPVGSVELGRVARLATAVGADRQRAWARTGGSNGLVARLAERFAPTRATRHRTTSHSMPRVEFP
ncbi:MAG: hypothetical protein WAL38_08325 [Solirubrobacteraceae bacterium]